MHSHLHYNILNKSISGSALYGLVSKEALVYQKQTVTLTGKALLFRMKKIRLPLTVQSPMKNMQKTCIMKLLPHNPFTESTDRRKLPYHF